MKTLQWDSVWKMRYSVTQPCPGVHLIQKAQRRQHAATETARPPVITSHPK